MVEPEHLSIVNSTKNPASVIDNWQFQFTIDYSARF